MSDLISRQAAIDALGERPTVWTDDDDYALGERNQYDMDRLAIETVPSAQLAQDLTNGCTDTISRAAVVDAIEGVDWYHQNKNGEMVHGANSDNHQAWYKADDIYKAIESVLSAQPGWIPCSERPPEKSEWYLLTAEWDDGLTTVMKDRYVVGEGWTCAVFGAKCLAWQSLPTPYREGRQDDH